MRERVRDTDNVVNNSNLKLCHFHYSSIKYISINETQVESHAKYLYVVLEEYVDI